MANSAIVLPTLLTDPGYLYWAPIGTALPTPVSSASAFSDIWPAAWIPIGMTESGTDFDNTLTVSPILGAEMIDPIAYRTTMRDGTLSFLLLDFTATKLAHAFNGASTTVTGAGVTTITKIDPPTPGTETRGMIGYESLDSTFRFIAYQVLNSGSVKMSFNKAPAKAGVQWTGKLEKPAGSQPWSMWTAGAARA
jgi:hypothetical protein